MDTAVRTPLEIFGLPQHLVVPLFQRPYVWNREEQWEPMWADVRRIADLRLTQPSSTATHFLGAIVLEALDTQAGILPRRSIIDGQQRLTTLQLLFDAIAAIFEERDLGDLALQLAGLGHNPVQWVTENDTLKLRHSNRDVEPFREVMQADPPIEYSKLGHAGSLLVKAHQYFAQEIDRWLGAAEDKALTRAQTLVGVLTTGLQVVVIDLRKDENSQEIFETLNARGTPLTAADLIKNFVFQRLAVEGVDTKQAYSDLWPFDTTFWETTVSVGRYPVSRGSLFLNQWLISRVGEEIGPRSTFTRFKHYVEYEAGATMRSLLHQIKGQAGLCQGWLERAADPHASLTSVELCVYRTQAIESEVIKPILIWLHEPGRIIASEVIDRVVQTTESWLVRRALLRLPGADHGRVVADLLVALRSVSLEDVGGRSEEFFRRQTASSNYWPGNEELRRSLATDPAYRRFKRGRLRMFLEAAEDHLRGYTGGGLSRTGVRVARVGHPIEHVLPQSWQAHWPVDGLAAEMDRDTHVHRLGNLTLLTTSLNSSVSNGPWAGENGKRAKLEQHDVSLLNRAIRLGTEGGWDEQAIDARTTTLIEAFIATWPVPADHVGMVEDKRPVSETMTVTVRSLLAAGLLEVGQRLHARPGTWADMTCEVLSNGDLLLADQQFTSLSAAGHYVRGAPTYGWNFWRLAGGRRLKDLRTEFIAQLSNAPAKSDTAPFSDGDLLRGGARLGDLVLLADRVSALLSWKQPRLMPGAANDPGFLWRRYVALGSSETYVAIGVRDSDWTEGGPLWMRLHRDTVAYEVSSHALIASEVTAASDGSGHTWVPLAVPEGVPMGELVQEVLDRASALMEIIRSAADIPADKGDSLPSQEISDVDWGEASDKTVKQPLYKAFWALWIAWIKSEHPDWPRAKLPPHYAWFTMPTGVAGVVYYASFTRRGLSCELNFESPDTATNLAALNSLLEVRSEVESHYGRPLEWESISSRKSTRIADFRTGADITQESEWGDHLDWLADRLTRLRLAVNAVGGPYRTHTADAGTTAANPKA